MEKSISNGDFVEVDYVGRIKDSGIIFDTTLADVARELKLKGEFKPMIAIVGSGKMIRGFENALLNRRAGEEFEVEIKSEDAFGEVDPKLLISVPLKHFKEKDKVRPGAVVEFENSFGIVRSVSSGRVVIYFNHPLAGKYLVYKIFVRRILEDDVEKVRGIISYFISKDFEIEIKGKEVIINLNNIDLPIPIKQRIYEDVRKYINKDYVLKFVVKIGENNGEV